MGLDFTSASCDIQIIKHGKIFDKSNLSYFFNSITSVTMRMIYGHSVQVTVTLEPTIEDAFKILTSGIIGVGASLKPSLPANAANSVDPQPLGSAPPPANDNSAPSKIDGSMATMVVRFLWNNSDLSNGNPASTPLYSCKIFQPDIDISNGDIKIVLNGYSKEAVLMATNGSFVFPENTSILAAIQSILDPLEIIVSFDKSDSQTKLKLTGRKIFRPYVGQAIDVVKSILDEINCSFSFSQQNSSGRVIDTILIKSREAELIQPKMVFVQWRQPDTSATPPVYPLFSLQMKNQGILFTDDRIFGHDSTVFDSDTKSVKDKSYDPGDNSQANPPPQQNSNVKGGALPLKSKTAKGHMGHILQRGDTTNADRTEQHVNIYAQGYIKMHLTSPGIPDIFTGDLVQLITGDHLPALSGFGNVYEIVHSWNGEGWNTAFTFNMTGGIGQAANNFKPDGFDDNKNKKQATSLGG